MQFFMLFPRMKFFFTRNEKQKSYGQLKMVISYAFIKKLKRHPILRSATARLRPNSERTVIVQTMINQPNLPGPNQVSFGT